MKRLHLVMAIAIAFAALTFSLGAGVAQATTPPAGFDQHFYKEATRQYTDVNGDVRNMTIRFHYYTNQFSRWAFIDDIALLHYGPNAVVHVGIYTLFDGWFRMRDSFTDYTVPGGTWAHHYRPSLVDWNFGNPDPELVAALNVTIDGTGYPPSWCQIKSWNPYSHPA